MNSPKNDLNIMGVIHTKFEQFTSYNNYYNHKHLAFINHHDELELNEAGFR